MSVFSSVVSLAWLFVLHPAAAFQEVLKKVISEVYMYQIQQSDFREKSIGGHISMGNQAKIVTLETWR